ncbi:MAG: hypothetical protein L0312_19240 [Acidobacteria bacterium]|nr:hypothetical protein [Acidobacteriota bacterium]
MTKTKAKKDKQEPADDSIESLRKELDNLKQLRGKDADAKAHIRRLREEEEVAKKAEAQAAVKAMVNDPFVLKRSG